MNLRIVSCLLAGLAVASAASATEASVEEVPAGGRIVVEVTHPQHSVRATLTTTVMPEARESNSASALVERECQTRESGPCSLVTMLEIVVNGRQLFVPRSSLAGLRNIRSAKLIVELKTFRLVLRGGDGAEGFVATIVFDRERVLKRLFASSLEPNDVLEETAYRLQKESFDR